MVELVLSTHETTSSIPSTKTETIKNAYEQIFKNYHNIKKIVTQI